MKLPINNFTIHSIGVDIGFGSSNTAVVATEFLKEEGKIRVTYAQEWEHGDPQAIVNLIFNLYSQYGTDNTFIFVDGSNRAFVISKGDHLARVVELGEIKITPDRMKVIPVPLLTDHKHMLSHLAMMITKGYLCIPKEYDKFPIALRIVYANELSLDKEKTSYSDSLDAFRLSCKMYKMN